jgi:Leucine-rich repeat (LRR) protein
MTKNLENLNQLIKSGEINNINLAIQLAQSLSITKEELLEPWKELIELFAPRLRTCSEIETLSILLSSKKLDLSYSNTSKLPESISKLEHLEELSLYKSKIYIFPQSLKKLSNLKKVFLGKTPITIKEINQLKALLPHSELYF